MKFSLAEDDRPVLATEIAAAQRSIGTSLGLAIARSLAIADRLLEESAGWLWIGGRIPDTSGRTSRGAALLDRFADRLGELAGTPAPDGPGERRSRRGLRGRGGRRRPRAAEIEAAIP